MTFDPTGDGDRAPTGTRRALKWSVIAQFVARIGSFTLGLVLARLLSPANFGTYTVALGVFTLLLTIDDLGILKALVRWPGEFADAAPTARTIATCSSLGVYAISFVLAPMIADITGAPAATNAIRALCAGIVVDAVLQIVPAASLQRQLRQDLWVIVEVARLVVTASVTIPLAAGGGGVWALVIGALAGQAAGMIANVVLAHEPFAYGFDRKVARELVVVSAPYALAAFVSAALLNVDYLVIGNVLGPAAVGLYLVAFNVSSWPNSLVGAAVRAVAIPSFSRLHHSGRGAGDALRRGLVMLVAGGVPFSAILIAAPTAVVGSLYGDRWTPGSVALPWLAVMSLVRLLDGLVDDALFASGRSTWILFKNTVWLAALLVALPVGAHVGGIRGVGIGQAIVACAVVSPIVIVFLHRADFWRRELVGPGLGLLAAGAVAATVGAVIVHRLDTPAFVTAAVATVVVLTAYAPLVVRWRTRLFARD